MPPSDPSRPSAFGFGMFQKRDPRSGPYCGKGGVQCSLELAFGIFMLGRNGKTGEPSDFFSWSTGDYWYTKDWSWDDGSGVLYSREYGPPHGPAVRAGSVWRREYRHASIAVDCAMLKTNITMRL